MELRHLRYFKAVADHLNFSRAAEQLHVAQPALSRQIQAAEDELGAKLFERNRVSVRLTDAGRVFYRRACKILAEVDMAVAAVREVSEGSGGVLVISNDWHLGSDFVAGTLAEFRARYPRIEVVLHDRKIPDQVALLRSRRVHLGFIIRDIFGAKTDLQTLLLRRSRLLLALPARHRLARRTSVRLAELADETWLTFDPQESPAYTQYLTRLCRFAGFTPLLGEQATTPEGIIGRVASGYGIALMPEHIELPANRLLRYVPTDSPPLELCAAWHRDEKSELLKHYLAILRQHLTASLPKTDSDRA